MAFAAYALRVILFTTSIYTDTNITRTKQIIYIEVVAEEITVIKVFRETSIKTVLKKAVSKVIDLIINIIYYHHSLNKRSAIYIGNLNAS